ncbi:MAG TPA: FHA domain-containing protein [Woeseiaceae bacterium]|nr:FHA domain-containing protein [Woeseiaceae bacterium]
MTRIAAHINDAAITVLSGERIVYREPGFALLDAREFTSGNEAFAKARINPRRIQHRYWSNLTTEPLTVHGFSHLTAADLVSRQLEQMWRAGGSDADELVVAVPAYMDAQQLGLFLGIASELELPVVAMVDAAVAATRREYRNAVPVHIDMGLHATVLTRLAQPDRAQFDRAEVMQDSGLYALYDIWLNALAQVFVQQSRFDPLHTAETEQMLLDNLARWLAQAARKERVQLQLPYAGIDHTAEIESLVLIGAAAPVYQQIASRLRALYRAGDTPAIQVTDRIARLPGLPELLKARVGGEVFVLEAGATARGALARVSEGSAKGSGISLRRQLFWDRSATEVERDETAPAHAAVPTHLLFGSKAYAVAALPLVLGSQPDDGERTIALGTGMPGISRRHCSVKLQDGHCVLEDHSRYGTFLNGYRIDGSTVLQVGDFLRIGSPGFEFHLITTDEAYGT